MANGENGHLVMTCTPLRVSFAGGGTDLPCFFEHETGAVLSSTIDKYVYVTVKRHGHLFNETYRLNYAETEYAGTLDEIRNDIARECLRLVPVDPPLYISTVGDVPSASGLGSSSSFAVGLLKALHAFRGERVSAAQLTEEAVRVEIGALHHPIGKQDQAAAAYGGLNLFHFQSNGSIHLEQHSPVTARIDVLFSCIQMFWTGITRDSSSVLTEQKLRAQTNMDVLRNMRDQANHLNELVRNGLDIEEFGAILDEGWHLKKTLSSNISNSLIDVWYERARKAGALGGRVCGAGGGGFLLFVTPPERHAAIRGALADLEEISVKFEPNGSRLLVVS